jgi:hypothetical protein
MLLPSANNATFRARPSWRSLTESHLVSAPLLGTNGIALTANARIPLAVAHNPLIVGRVSFVALTAATATTYTVQLGRRTAAGVDVPLSTAQSMLAAGITAAGGLNRQNLFTQLATLTDSQRMLQPGDFLYLDVVVNTLTVQPVLAIAVETFLRQ